jgi:arylsulfatase A
MLCSSLLLRTLVGTLTFLSAINSLLAQPNVLLIVADDQGFSDFGFTGNPKIKTPHLDSLAKESAQFQNFIVAAACSPTRAALFTGREHLRTGVWGVAPKANLLNDEKLMPAYFLQAGYSTMIAGKQDTIGTAHGSKAKDRGWEKHWLLSGGYENENPTVLSDHHIMQAKGWTSSLITNQLSEFIRANSARPWLAVATFISPHIPWACEQSYAKPYLDAGMSADLALCYGTITQMDANIGRLLSTLQTTGQADNTIVIFLSDNGMSERRNDLTPLPTSDWAQRNHHRLRGHKAQVFENGIRVPLLIRYSGKVIPGQRSHFATVEDVLPTVLDLAGVSHPATDLPFTGKSLRPILEDPSLQESHTPVLRIAISGEGAPRQAITWLQHRGQKQPRMRDLHLTLRGPRFKYHAMPKQASTLYDLENDPSESVDVSKQYPKIFAKMEQQCRAEWENILQSERAFRQAIPLIHCNAELPEAQMKSNRVEALQAQHFDGQLKFSSKQVHGFTTAKDSASYSINVVDAGKYDVVVRCSKISPSHKLSLTLNEKPLAQPSLQKNSLHFGTVTFPAGLNIIKLSATSDVAKLSPIDVSDLLFTWSDQNQTKTTH